MGGTGRPRSRRRREAGLCIAASVLLHAALLVGLVWARPPLGPPGEGVPAGRHAGGGASALRLRWVALDAHSARERTGAHGASTRASAAVAPTPAAAAPARPTAPDRGVRARRAASAADARRGPLAVSADTAPATRSGPDAGPTRVVALAPEASEPAVSAGPAAAASAAQERGAPAGTGTGVGVGAGADAGPAFGPGDVDRVARPAQPIRPLYPSGARQRGEEADVVVEARVGALGAVDDVAVLRSAGPDFDEEAARAVREARFHPALRAGERVPSRVALRVHFRLDR